MSNIIDSIQISGVTYTIQGSGGGGKAIEGGRGISVTTGATADTVSFNLPISAGTGTNSIQEGDYTTASGDYSHAEGRDTTASGDSAHAEGYQTLAGGNYSHAEGGDSTASGNRSHAEGSITTAGGFASHAEGIGTEANNGGEHASGKYNVSHTGSTEADKTLFSVGNGTYDDDRHNAFEIRQNGDIYLNNGTSDVKLQDYIQIKVIKLTQSEYDALATKDSNTLYVING